jgi:hypothetical protein
MKISSSACRRAETIYRCAIESERAQPCLTMAAMCSADSTRMNRIIRKDGLFMVAASRSSPRACWSVSYRNGQALIPLTRITPNL